MDVDTIIVVILIDRYNYIYPFSGNGGANLHKNGTWDIFRVINIANSFLLVFSQVYTPIRNIFTRVHGNTIYPLEYASIHVSSPCRLQYGSNGTQIHNYFIICFTVFYASWCIYFSVQHQQMVIYNCRPLIKKHG